MTLSAPLGGSYLHDSFSLDVEHGPLAQGQLRRKKAARQLQGNLGVDSHWTRYGDWFFWVDPRLFLRGEPDRCVSTPLRVTENLILIYKNMQNRFTFLDAIAGCHCWVPLLGCHCWVPLLGAVAGCCCWVSLLGAIAGGCHCWVPLLGAVAGRRCCVSLLGDCWGVPLLGVIAGCHCWVPLLGTIAGYHCWVPLLGAVAGCHCWVSCHCWVPLLGCRCWVPLLGVIAGCRCWVSLLGVGCHCWVPLHAVAIAGCHCWMLATSFGRGHVGCHCWVPCWGAIARRHCWVPLREKIDQSVTPFSAAPFSTLITRKLACAIWGLSWYNFCIFRIKILLLSTPFCVQRF